jgi:alpha-beta hydrolase superfamily lysophospholipase
MPRRVTTVLLCIVIAYLGLALACTFWPYPAPFGPPPTDARSALSAPAEHPAARDQAAERSFRMRDGATLRARAYSAIDASALIVLVHGVTATSDVMAGPAARLRDATGTDVLAIDLRGHGRSDGAPWHVAYVGQYEDDLADLVAHLRAEELARPLALAGHSMGGGIALRYALRDGAPEVDGYLLIAPLLGGGAPTMQRPASAPAETPAHIRFHAPRFIGLLMLNVVGLGVLNHLPVLYFDVPPGMPAYSFAAVASMQPNPPSDYRAALAAIRVPLLVVAGADDRTFRADAYPAIVRAHGDADAVVIAGESHTSILESSDALAAIAVWLRERVRP